MGGWEDGGRRNSGRNYMREHKRTTIPEKKYDKTQNAKRSLATA